MFQSPHTTGTQAFALGIGGSHTEREKPINTRQGCILRDSPGSHSRDCREEETELTCGDGRNRKRKVWADLEAVVMEEQVFVHRDRKLDAAGGLAAAVTGAVCRRHSAPVGQGHGLISTDPEKVSSCRPGSLGNATVLP